MAFILRPDIPEEGAARQLRPGESGDQLAEPLRTHAEEAGLVMRRSSWTPYTMYALEATEYAQEQGQFYTFHLAAYKAFWERGENLGDRDVLLKLALECGLDREELSHRLESGHYRETVLSQYRQAIDLNIRGVPAFLIGNQLFTGAQPYEIFKLAMARAQESQHSPG